MDNNYYKAKEILEKNKQEHVIEFINKSDAEKKNKLINQVLNINFDELNKLYNMTFEELHVDLEELHPVTAVNPDKLTYEELEKYKRKGTDIIKSNKFAVCTMAGGQGTRLRTFRS